MLRARQNGGGKLRNAGGRGNGNGSPGGRGNNGNSMPPSNDPVAYFLAKADDGVVGNGYMIGDTSANDLILQTDVLPSGGLLATPETTQKKFGLTSFLMGGNSYKHIVANTVAAFGSLGTGDCGMSCWVYPAATPPDNSIFYDGRSVSNTNGPVIYQDSGGLHYLAATTDRITTTKLTTGVWSYLEWSRVSGVSRLFVNGVSAGTYADTTNFNSTVVRFGCGLTPTSLDTHYQDDLRFNLGGGNTTDYIVPTTQPADAYTVTSTWNPSDKASTVSLCDDNRWAYATTNFGAIRGTLGSSSGKKQFEVICMSDTLQFLVGIGQAGASLTNYPGEVATSWGIYSANGNKYNNNVATAYGSSFASSDVIGVVLDSTLNELRVYKNGVAMNATAITVAAATWYPMWGAGNNTAGTRNGKINTGQAAFKYPIAGATAWG